MLNEFRQDFISGEWVLFATGRAKGHLKPPEKEYQSKEQCPFENPVRSNGEMPHVVYSHGKKVGWQSVDPGNSDGTGWTALALNNKYPALQPGVCGDVRQFGPAAAADAFGFHELVITRDHDKSFAQFIPEETIEVLNIFQERYNVMSKDSCGKYVLIFHNHGVTAGATVYHNHSQIISLPFIPPGIAASLHNSESYYQRNGVSPFEVMIDWEVKEKKRIIFENNDFLVFCPYASRTPYEMRIYPKSHASAFGKLNNSQIAFLADALNTSLSKLYYAHQNPDYNFYIHTGPVDHNSSIASDAYRWHIEIVPRLSIIASVELSTNVYVNVVDPDDAAEMLRSTKI